MTPSLARVLVAITPATGLADPAGGGGGQTPSLPLLRWANAVATIHTHYGLGAPLAVGDPFLTAVAAFLFQVSALLWQVLGDLVNAAQGAGAVNFTVSRVNPIFARIGDVLLGTDGSTSVVVAVIVAAAGMVAYRSFKAGDGATGALKGLVGVLLPVGVLVVTVHAAAAAAGGQQQGLPQGPPTGSPAWAVENATGGIDALAGTVAGAFDQFGPVAPAGVDRGQDAGIADCDKYVQGLDNLYAQHAASGPLPARLQAANNVVLSQLWQAAVMQPWVDAQFGPGPLGQKAFCHLLEIQAGVPAGDQVAAMVADTPDGPYSRNVPGPTWSQVIAHSGAYVGPDDPHYATLLGPDYANGDDDLRRNLIAWAACDYVGGQQSDHGWTVDAAFTHVFHTSPSDGLGTCSTWWDKGNTKPPPTGGSLTVDGPFDFEDENAIQHATTANGNDSADARGYIQSLNGHNAGLATSTSIIALVSSMTYGWSLGGLALGVLIGKLSLIILVACGPIFLLLAAIPSESTRTAARRALGLTLAAVLSTFTFSILLGLLLVFIGVLQDLAVNLFKASETFGALIQGLVPLAALYLMRKLLRMVGMESVTSLRGAVKTTAALGQLGVRAGDHGLLRHQLSQLGGDVRRGAGSEGGRRVVAGAAGRARRPATTDDDRRLAPSTQTTPPPASLGWNRDWRRMLTAPGDRGPTALPPPSTAPPRRLEPGSPHPPDPIPAGVGASSRAALGARCDDRLRPAAVFPGASVPSTPTPPSRPAADPERVMSRYGEVVELTLDPARSVWVPRRP